MLDIHSKESIDYIKNYAMKEISSAIEEYISKTKSLDSTLKEYPEYGLLSNLDSLLLRMSYDTRSCRKILRDTRIRLQLIDDYEIAEKEEYQKFKSKLILVPLSNEE